MAYLGIRRGWGQAAGDLEVYEGIYETYIPVTKNWLGFTREGQLPPLLPLLNEGTEYLPRVMEPVVLLV